MTTVTKPTEDQIIVKDVEKVFAFGKSHLILLGLLFLALLGGVYLYDSKRTDRAEAAQALAVYQAQTADQQAKSAQAQNTARQQQAAQQIAALQLQVKTLADSIVARDKALTTQAATVPTLTPAALGAQWGTAATEPAPPVDASGNFQVPLPLAQKSVVALMTVPTLTQDNKDLNAELNNETQSVQVEQKALDSEKQAHAVDVAACTADKTALNATITTLKTKTRNSKIRSFLYGLATGAAAVAIHFIP